MKTLATATATTAAVLLLQLAPAACSRPVERAGDDVRAARDESRAGARHPSRAGSPGAEEKPGANAAAAPRSSPRAAGQPEELVRVDRGERGGRDPRLQMARLGYYGDDEPHPSAPHTNCPGAADGSELIGTAPPEWSLSDWANTDGAALTLAGLRGRVVVVRFWTTGCPFCEKTLPALERLARELRDQPVTIVGAFHAKPASSASDLKAPLETTRGWGITFPIALDSEWRTLRSWWLDDLHRHASSATFVIGKDGRVAHVHPGPEYYPTDDPSDRDADRDYAALRAAVLAAAAR